MTRKERKELATARKNEFKIEILERLQGNLDDGLPVRAAWRETSASTLDFASPQNMQFTRHALLEVKRSIGLC